MCMGPALKGGGARGVSSSPPAPLPPPAPPPIGSQRARVRIARSFPTRLQWTFKGAFARSGQEKSLKSECAEVQLCSCLLPFPPARALSVSLSLSRRPSRDRRGTRVPQRRALPVRRRTVLRRAPHAPLQKPNLRSGRDSPKQGAKSPSSVIRHSSRLVSVIAAGLLTRRAKRRV